MKRRKFGQELLRGAMTAGMAGSLARGTAQAQGLRAPRKNTLMHVGGDYHSVAGPGFTSKENLEYNLRYGVRHLTAQIQTRRGSPDGGWNAAELQKMKDDCDRYGITLEAIRMDSGYINAGDRQERDRELDLVIGNIREAARVGVKVITYHWTVIPIRRNGQTPGRGNSTYEAFRLEENWKDLPVGRSGRVDSEEYWGRIRYFLERVIPVAKEHDVRMACHPYDPPGLPWGYQGADNWDSPSVFEAIKRYEAIVDDPYNGFQVCLGTLAEGLKNPKAEVLPIVRYLGERGKLHQIHMRNIRGGLNNFEEVYPDEGEMDLFEVMRVLRDVQFAGSICPDHMPRHSADARGLQSFAFGYGYIKALIQAVNSEAQG